MTPTLIRYYVLDRGQAVQVDDVLTWARWFETAERTVAQDEIGDVRVSTIFHGLDQGFRGEGPPVLWETRVFGGPRDGHQRRYSSQADALVGHVEALALVMREGLAAARGES